jgi:hypothetical protein
MPIFYILVNKKSCLLFLHESEVKNMDLSFLKKLDFIRKFAVEVIQDVEQNQNGASGSLKRKIAIEAIQAILQGFSVDSTDEEIGRIVDGIVTGYNISKRFKKSA